MIRHIVAWNYNDELTEMEKKENAQKIKYELENLKESIDGIIELEVHVSLLSSSNKDIVLNSLFKCEESLAAYQIHPKHKYASSIVGLVMKNRVCIDYYE